MTSDRLTDRWASALLPANSNIQQVVRNLDQTGLQIALIVSEKGQLAGTITDGDIRRGLLRGLSLTSGIDSVMNREPLVAPTQLGMELVIHLMQANRIHQLPVVDEERKVVGLHIWDDLMAPGRRPNLMVIMAGGQGRRLRPYTENCPKPMLPVAGKPMLEHIIDRAKSQGFERFVLAIHFLGHMIEDHFGDGSRFGVEVSYLREDEPLGTAGAISFLQPCPDAPFLVSNGDVLTDINYGELLDFHVRHAAVATMAVRQHEWQHPFGVVHTSGVEIVGFEEKPVARTHISAGIYVLDPHLLGLLKAREYCDMPTLFARAQESGARTIAYPMHEPWLDVGRADDLARAQALKAEQTRSRDE